MGTILSPYDLYRFQFYALNFMLISIFICILSACQDYEVGHLLGKGGFASVYKAKCKTTGMEVAIKMVGFYADFS